MTGNPANPARLLREARKRAGLSQRELATRAGLTQSVVSAYESGRRKPAFETLHRLIEATGHEVHVQLGEIQESRMSGDIGRRVRRHRDEIVRLAAEHGATNVRIFGSVARGDETAGSDIDLLVDLEPHRGLFALMRLERELKELLAVDVDVVPAGSLRTALTADVARDTVPL